jgi:hypothetical protein
MIGGSVEMVCRGRYCQFQNGNVVNLIQIFREEVWPQEKSFPKKLINIQIFAFHNGALHEYTRHFTKWTGYPS